MEPGGTFTQLFISNKWSQSWCSWNIYPASLFGLCIWSTYLFNSWLGVTYVSMEDIYLTLGLLHCSLKKDLWKLIGCTGLFNIHWVTGKAREFQKNICFIDYAKAFDYVDHNKLWKILQEMGIPDYLTCLLRNLCAG